jgi:hypothetical protein
MNKKSDKKYSVGFKKPPQHTQFQPGRSGNPNGRPKKTDLLADVLRKELNARIVVVKDGKRLRVPMQQAIIKQVLNMAAKGDSKAFDNLLKAIKLHRPDGGDNLGQLVQEFRAIHIQHMALDQERNVSEAGGMTDETK